MRTYTCIYNIELFRGRETELLDLSYTSAWAQRFCWSFKEVVKVPPVQKLWKWRRLGITRHVRLRDFIFDSDTWTRSRYAHRILCMHTLPNTNQHMHVNREVRDYY